MRTRRSTITVLEGIRSLARRVLAPKPLWRQGFWTRPERIAIVLPITLLCFFGVAPVSAASDPSLYFEDATFDYYLEKTDTGTKLKVKETLNAVFSEKSTSHGPIRTIPFTNQAGKNITVDDLKITVTRNGEKETVADINKEDNYYKVKIGSSSKTVQGKQTYVLEYEFKNVITEYDTAGKDVSGSGGDHQELYWDTNGTGWPNEFKSVTANVHFAENYPVKEPAYCYTGYSGSNKKDCTVTRTADGFTFKTTKSLRANENMTFDIEFPAGTFVVPVYNNYLLIIIFSGICALSVIIILCSIKRYLKYASKNRKFAQNLLTAPQYLPEKELTVAEAGEIYLKDSKPTETATLLELAISHKVQLISEETVTKVLGKEKTVWKVKVEDLTDITFPQEKVLRILTGGAMPKNGEVIEIKKRTATSTLADLSRSYKSSARSLLKKKNFLESFAPSTKSSSISSTITVSLIIAAIFGLVAAPFVWIVLKDPADFNIYGYLVGSPWLIYAGLVVIFITFLTAMGLSACTAKYKGYTERGLEASNYLDGLKLYIAMAEKERLEFNQSAKNAPKDEKGLVRLYEKLLPYACLFGLEESWLKEIQKYYEALDYTPDWYNGTDILTYSILHNMIHTTSSTISSNASWHSSSSSSGFSGGGGGGFSGGGGGGGGGGSW